MREDYALLECIGRGSYSRVYRVRNVHTGEVRCAKNVRVCVKSERYFFPQCVDAAVCESEYRDISDHAVREISSVREESV